MKRRDWIISSGIIVALILFFVLVMSAMMLRGGASDSLSVTAPKEQLGLVVIQGMILDPTAVLEQLENFSDEPKVKGVLVRIESPGGTVGASQEIYAELKKFRAGGKKVVVSMGNVAASGGFYIACASDTIMADPGTITGSIGVRSEFLSTQELLKKIGVKFNVIKSGKYKDMGSMSRDMTKDEEELLQSVINDLYGQFVEAVASSRRLPIDKVKEIADGRILTGQQARALGLVDCIGNYRDAGTLLAAMCGIKGKPVFLKKKKKFMELLTEYSEDMAHNLSPQLSQWTRMFYAP
jgi:protease-4